MSVIFALTFFRKKITKRVLNAKNRFKTLNLRNALNVINNMIINVLMKILKRETVMYASKLIIQ
jgi:hypothetical protein